MDHIKTTISAAALAAAVAFALAGSATPARAGEVGVFGFYQVKDAGRYSEVLKALEGSLGGRGCAVRREGEIATTDGSLNVDKPNRFLLVECTGPLLAARATRALFGPLEAVTSHLVLAEGKLQRFADGFSAPGVGRAYLIKVSHYNDRNPKQRDRELAAIQQRVETRSDRYQNEAIITPSRALGMTTPDEVVVLSYDDSKAAERFRKANGDILEAIGAFNEAHLVTFAYFTASSAR